LGQSGEAEERGRQSEGGDIGGKTHGGNNLLLNFGEPYGPTPQKRQETKESGRFFEKKLRKKLL
jgi:hypothetical protein